ncbi:hypothetical protein A2335_00775 [Candidatus Peregrinibacteria bacterium RIFOXYB2_FULL_32_7]|nr:MAG: hypothetical protein A2335_00775 [Candidatus Peregrinibacteria bacterium RIFOXYB2_FULL_32_7]
MIKAVLFDIDDTIYEFLPVHKKALKTAHEVYLVYEEISESEFEKQFQQSWDIVKSSLKGTASGSNRVLIFQNLVERRLKRFDSSIILELYNAYWNSFLDDITLFEGVLDLLEFLKNNNIKIGFITDLTAFVQMRKLSKFKLSGYIDAFVSSEECGNNKPHKIIFDRLLQKLGVSPETAIMVGDTASKDIAGAKRLNIRTIQLLKGIFAKKSDGEEKADYYVANFSEIKSILEKLC